MEMRVSMKPETHETASLASPLGEKRQNLGEVKERPAVCGYITLCRQNLQRAVRSEGTLLGGVVRDAKCSEVAPFPLEDLLGKG